MAKSPYNGRVIITIVCLKDLERCVLALTHDGLSSYEADRKEILLLDCRV